MSMSETIKSYRSSPKCAAAEAEEEEEEKEEDRKRKRSVVGKSICLCALNNLFVMEWYVFPILDNDFKYDAHLIRKRFRTPRNLHHHKNDTGTGRTGTGKFKLHDITKSCMLPHFNVQWVTLDSTIFTFGSVLCPISPPPTGGKISRWYLDPPPATCIGSEVNSFKINNNNDDIAAIWKSAPSMIQPRSYLEALVFDGKIYVFGSAAAAAASDDCSVFGSEPQLMGAEVFDPSIQQWQPLQPPSDGFKGFIPSHLIVAALDDDDHDRKGIFVGSTVSKKCYFYHVSEARWNKEPDLKTYHHGAHKSISGRAEVFGRILLWFSRFGELVGYNLDNSRWLQCPVKGLLLDTYLKSGRIPRLLHIQGDMFCLVWADDEEQPHPDEEDSADSDFDRDSDYSHHFPSRIHCAKFYVSTSFDSKNKLVLSASLTSCQSYVIDHYLRFQDARLMDDVLRSGNVSSGAADQDVGGNNAG